MTHDEALHHVARLGIAAQKVRSNLDESGLADVSAQLTPWLYGDRNVLRGVERVQQAGAVDPQGFYNLMWVADRPEMRPLLDVLFAVNGEEPLPEPSLEWLRGWDEAANEQSLRRESNPR